MDLVALGAEALGPDVVQFSPLVPGAAALEALSPGSLAAMTILAPPGTVERRYVIALALKALGPGAALTVLALKDKGGSRIAKELAAFGCDAGETSRKHFRICETLRPETFDREGREFIATAIEAGAPRLVPELGLWTQPGIFSFDRLDPGSALLLDHLPAFSGRGADLGCGIGVLSAAVLRSPKVTALALVDIDRRAVEAARRNVGDARASLRWADVRTAELGLAGLDFVVMNPPFHDAGIEDRGLGQGFIRQAATMLRPGGFLWLTANRHLPYEDILKPLFKLVTKRAEDGGYKIFEARK
ncbi:class I SAM-dependent methyltransferase [Aureimonas sp. SA4125]|uniref:class I SAM-dependent methyltransferase n=1 Tax=Aureimonas sp. SA4125 TaxID=2826993 RepID=UPI001CC3DF50|nr:class I SAM-dependent methyltransferase [Aureimonas sp. SA4125]